MSAPLLHAVRHFGAMCRSKAARVIEQGFPGLGKRCAVCGVVSGSPEPTNRSTAAGLWGKNQGASGFCDACRVQLQRRTRGFCPRCGLIHGASGEPATICLQCRLTPPKWGNVFFYGPYEGCLKTLVLRFKFQGQLGLGAVLQELLRQALMVPETADHDLVVPVPLHARRLRQRGFNQSLELARGVAGNVFGRLEHRALIRVRDTPPQHTLPRLDRMHNLTGAFMAESRLVSGRSVLLVDDILTTGATVHAATKALLRGGASRVNLLVLARA